MAGWAYRCGSCHELVEVDDLENHIADHKADQQWNGVISFGRVDKQEEGSDGR